MSVLRPAVLVCDHHVDGIGAPCGRKYVSGETDESIARSAAELEGWSYNPDDDADTCPVHNAPNRAWRH